MKNKTIYINILLTIFIFLLLAFIFGLLKKAVYQPNYNNNENIVRVEEWKKLNSNIEFNRIVGTDYSYVTMESADVNNRVCNEKSAYAFRLKNIGKEKIIIEQENVVITFNNTEVITRESIGKLDEQGNIIESTSQKYPLEIHSGEVGELKVIYDEQLNNIHKTLGTNPRESEVIVKIYLNIDDELFQLNTGKEIIISCSTSEL